MREVKYMPLDEREREELAKKINQQRRAMWKGQVTKERRTKEKRRKEEQPPETQQQDEGIAQTPEPLSQAVEEDPQKEPGRIEQLPERVKEREKEELAEKIRQQRRAVWRGKPEARSKRKKRGPGSAKRVLNYQQEIEPAEQRDVNQPNKPKEKSRDYKSKAPTLKLALIVILGLIGAIAIGVAIGYIAASRGLINI